MNWIKRLFFNDTIMLVLVLINTCFIFASGYGVKSGVATSIDSFFTILFLVEAILKIRENGWKEYWSSGWNRFDFIIVVLALPTLPSLFVDMNLHTSVLLSLRALRIFKTFRLLQFVPNINALIRGVNQACRASFVVVIGIAVMLIISSILTYNLFGSKAPEYFGDPGLAFYNTFRLFTIEGWYDMPEAIVANSTPLWGIIARIYFSILLFCGGILGMSLVNSIFVDAMVADNNDEVLDKLNELQKKLDELNEKLGK